MPGLLGTAEATIDIKTRASIPARFHKSYETENITLWRRKDARTGGSFLMLLTEQEFRRIFDREYKAATPQRQEELLRRISKNTETIPLDKNGRFVIPPLFCAKTGISAESKVYFIGCMTYVEIWSKPLWEAREDDDDFEINAAPDPEWLTNQ